MFYEKILNDSISKTVKINDYIELRLQDNSPVIYIKGQRVIGCKKLLLDIPLDKEMDLKEINSIDDTIRFKSRRGSSLLSLETEFWGHWSV